MPIRVHAGPDAPAPQGERLRPRELGAIAKTQADAFAELSTNPANEEARAALRSTLDLVTRRQTLHALTAAIVHLDDHLQEIVFARYFEDPDEVLGALDLPRIPPGSPIGCGRVSR